MTRRFLVLMLVSASLAACGGGSGGSTPVTCNPSGTQLSVKAQNIRFDKDCLAAPANQATTISFDNQDNGVPHNIQVFAPNGSSVFKGAIITGVKTTTYQVPALAPGRYPFRCDVHPDSMQGTFVVK